MDGQGNMKTQALESVLELTNLIILNFNRTDINNKDHFKDLKLKIELVKSKHHQIYVILIIRDSLKTGLIDIEEIN
jgi:hypothetical protein